MGQTKRILIGVGVLALIVALVMGIDAVQRRTATPPPAVIATATGLAAAANSPAATTTQVAGAAAATATPQAEPTFLPTLVITLQPGSIPIYVNGVLSAAFLPSDLDKLEQVSFVEPAEGKTEEGWLLIDVLQLYLPDLPLQTATRISVSSSSREKSAELSWAEVEMKDNMVMFDLAGRGTLKLVSKLEKLDTREEWVQDVDKIEVELP